jgi:hypothetical protein
MDIGQTMVNLGHHLEKPHQKSLMTFLIQSTYTCSPSLVKDLVRPYVNPNVLEHPPELLPRSPNT